MRYTAATVKYFEVIDNETGLTVEKYNTEAEAEAVADILNRSSNSEPENDAPGVEPSDANGFADGQVNEPLSRRSDFYPNSTTQE